ncbi:MAG: hypothetical protein U9P80_08875 [Thermodesulfobacteriota bacterium]|nr:hypothetical protein [Thermodesulfobacteriota bacterium]
MAGAADISTMLSQAGRIEKINQSPFSNSEIAKQILTDQEAQERLRQHREVNASKKGDEIHTRDRKKGSGSGEQGKSPRSHKGAQETSKPDENSDNTHLIDVVI